MENMTREGKIIILERPSKRNFFFFLVKFCATAKILHFLCFETSFSAFPGLTSRQVPGTYITSNSCVIQKRNFLK